MQFAANYLLIKWVSLLWRDGFVVQDCPAYYKRTECWQHQCT